MKATIYWKFLFSSRLAVTRTLLLSLTLVLSIALAASQTLPCDASHESNPKTLDNTSKMAGNRERTFIMLKPDAVQRGLVGDHFVGGSLCILQDFQVLESILVKFTNLCVHG